MRNTDIFKHFQRRKRFDGKARSHPKIYFQIGTDDYGAFLRVVDKNGNAIETNYLAYSGVHRNLLRSIEQIQEKNSFLID